MEPYLNDPILFFLDRLLFLISTYWCAVYFYIKMCKIQLNKKRTLFLLGNLIIIPMLCQSLGGNSNYLIKLFYMVYMVVSLILINRRNLYFAIPTAIISVSIAYCLEYLSVFIIGTVLYFARITELNIFISLSECIVQFFLCYIITKLRIINKSFHYLDNISNFGIGLIISSYIFGFSLLLIHYKELNSKFGFILLACIPLLLVGFILWIRSMVKRFYKSKLQDRMDEYTKKEMENKNKRIEQLEAEVTTLAKQVHRDNHLMTSVDRSVQELAECESTEQREQIIGEIHTMYLERNDSIAKEQQKNKILPSTGFALIDSSLSELYVKAAARGIGFDLTVSEEPYYLVNNIISQTDLQTLLCDHIKDAIIAVETAGITNGRILVTIEKNDSIFEITIRDNGVDFEPDTLAKLGREQVTTHADDGGSGIGFMTTFETLQKTKGSLIITEYEQKTPFSKSVAFVFDGLNRFVISTYRKEELEKSIDRDDLLIL